MLSKKLGVAGVSKDLWAGMERFALVGWLAHRLVHVTSVAAADTAKVYDRRRSNGGRRTRASLSRGHRELLAKLSFSFTVLAAILLFRPSNPLGIPFHKGHRPSNNTWCLLWNIRKDGKRDGG